jgi:hypothetical protein
LPPWMTSDGSTTLPRLLDIFCLLGSNTNPCVTNVLYGATSPVATAVCSELWNHPVSYHTHRRSARGVRSVCRRQLTWCGAEIATTSKHFFPARARRLSAQHLWQCTSRVFPIDAASLGQGRVREDSPRCWSDPSRYTSAGRDRPRALSTAAHDEPLSNHTSRVSVPTSVQVKLRRRGKETRSLSQSAIRQLLLAPLGAYLSRTCSRLPPRPLVAVPPRATATTRLSRAAPPARPHAPPCRGSRAPLPSPG